MTRARLIALAALIGACWMGHSHVYAQGAPDYSGYGMAPPNAYAPGEGGYISAGYPPGAAYAPNGGYPQDGGYPAQAGYPGAGYPGAGYPGPYAAGGGYEVDPNCPPGAEGSWYGDSQSASMAPA